MTGDRWNPALVGSLMMLVPLRIADYRDLSDDARIEIAREAGEVVASQGDTLQYGNRLWMGHGARQMEDHLTRAPKDAKCSKESCWCNQTGQPEYSAGEVLGFLSRGLACAAYQAGGITFAGLHFCVNHDECIAAERAESCPTCTASASRP